MQTHGWSGPALPGPVARNWVICLQPGPRYGLFAFATMLMQAAQ